jgi:hypothetical protein
VKVLRALEHSLSRRCNLERKSAAQRREGRGGAVPQGLSKNGVTVVVVQNHEIVVASARRNNEASSLVDVDLAGRFNDGSVAKVTAFVVGRRREGVGVEEVLVLGHCQRVGCWRGHLGDGHSLGRTLILARLDEMAFERSVRPLRILAERSRGEAGKVHQKKLECLRKVGENRYAWAKATSLAGVAEPTAPRARAGAVGGGTGGILVTTGIRGYLEVPAGRRSSGRSA